MNMKMYEIKTLAEIAELLPTRMVRHLVAPSRPVYVSSTEIDAASLRALELPRTSESLGANNRTERMYLAPALECWELTGAEVHGGTGIVTIDGFVAAESLRSNFTGFGFFAASAGSEPFSHITIEHQEYQKPLREAVHLQGEGAYNYHHHWFDGALRAALLEPGARDLPVLVSPYSTDFQEACFDLVGVHAEQRVVCEQWESRKIDRLVYPGDTYVMEQYRPHPFLRRELCAIVARAGGRLAPAGRKLYIDRQAAYRRPLRNECALAEALRARGYDVAQMEKVDVAQQVRLFAGAECVVAPHGSGLINTMFGGPWCATLELFPHVYVNWPNRYCAQLARGAYGARVFSDVTLAEGETPCFHARWTAAIDRVLEAEAAMLPHHYFHEIPGWFDYEDLYEEIVATAPPNAKLVEVGSWMGRSMAFLGVEAKTHRPDLKLYAVDRWGTFTDGAGWDHQLDHRAYALAHGGDLRACWTAAMSRGKLLYAQGGPVLAIEEDSARAAEHFTDAAVHFAFIDAAHDEAAVLKDIRAWLPKIASGGILAGHDLPHGEVRAAVERVFGPERDGGWEKHGASCWLVRR